MYIFFIVVILLRNYIVNSDVIPVGNAYTLLDKTNTDCEMNCLNLGSKLVDYYNSYDEHTNKSTRMFNDIFDSYLNFDSWLQPKHHYANNHVISNNGNDIKNNIEELVKHQQKLELATKDSLYKVLNNKWIYFYGDSTLKQLFQTFLRLDHINLTSTADIYDFYNKNCNMHNKTVNINNNIDFLKPSPTKVTSTTINLEDIEQNLEDTSMNIHHNLHHVSINDKICHMDGLSQYGSNSRISFDWKQTHYNSYDNWLFGENDGNVYYIGMWSKDSSKQRPDIFVIQAGRHICAPITTGSLKKQHHALHYDSKSVQEQEKMLFRLLKHIKIAINRHIIINNQTIDNNNNNNNNNNSNNNSNNKTTIVIILTNPRYFTNNINSDRCIWRVNRIIAKAAHMMNFPVLEREEIEHRLTYKSEYSHKEALKILKLGDHLGQPISSIISTTLLSMINCLTSVVT